MATQTTVADFGSDMARAADGVRTVRRGLNWGASYTAPTCDDCGCPLADIGRCCPVCCGGCGACAD